MGWFGKSKKDTDDGYLPPRVPYASLNGEAQRRRRAETDPVLAAQIIEEERSWRNGPGY